MGTHYSVLCVDDDPDFLDLSATYLESDSSFTVQTAESAAEGLDVLTSDQQVDAVVSDYQMPETDGIEFLREVRETHPDLPFILFTGKGSEAVAGKAIRAGVTDYLQKGGPETYDLLRNRLSNVLDHHDTKANLERERQIRERILEASPVGIVGHDLDGTVVFRNQQAMDILTVPERELDGQAYPDASWELQQPDGKLVEQTDLPYVRVIDSAEPISDERYTLTSEGGTHSLKVYGAPLFEDGDVVGAVIAFLVDGS